MGAAAVGSVVFTGCGAYEQSAAHQEPIASPTPIVEVQKTQTPSKPEQKAAPKSLEEPSAPSLKPIDVITRELFTSTFKAMPDGSSFRDFMHKKDGIVEMYVGIFPDGKPRFGYVFSKSLPTYILPTTDLEPLEKNSLPQGEVIKPFSHQIILRRNAQSLPENKPFEEVWVVRAIEIGTDQDVSLPTFWVYNPAEFRYLNKAKKQFIRLGKGLMNFY